MQTKIATALANGSAKPAAAALIEHIRQQLGGDQPSLVIAFASMAQPLAEVVEPLRAAFDGATVLGSSTAGEFTEKGDAKDSVVVWALAGDFKVHAGIGTDLQANAEKAVTAAISNLPAEEADYKYRTGILMLDPMAGNGEEATLIAAALMSIDEPIRLAGGAAGDDLAMKETYVACNDKVAANAVVIATVFSKSRLGIGVQHGHEPLSEPLKVTKAQGNVVYEIEGRPAWEVWAEQTRESAAKRGVDPDKLSEDELGGFLLRYEAGLASGEAYKIRAPLSRNEDGSLAFACGIPQGAVVRITESEPSRQVQSAREAAKRAREQLGNAKPAGALVFDCICRNLILSEEFKDAVHGISAELDGAPIAGFETYGEIALDVGDMSGFHNTTTVVLAFPQ